MDPYFDNRPFEGFVTLNPKPYTLNPKPINPKPSDPISFLSGPAAWRGVASKTANPQSLGPRLQVVLWLYSVYLKDQMTLKSRGPVPMYYESLYER